MVLVTSESADETRIPNTRVPEPDIVLRAALRAALDSVMAVCDQLFAELETARRESREVAATAAERVGAIQAEAESATQRVRLEAQLEITELRREVERLRHDLKTPLLPQPEPRNVSQPAVPHVFECGIALDHATDPKQQIERLNQALAISRSDFEEVQRRLEEEKQKHARLFEAVRSMGSKIAVFTPVPLTPAEAGDPTQLA